MPVNSEEQTGQLIPGNEEFYPVQGVSLNVSDYIKIVKRRKWSVLLPGLIISGISILLAFSLPLVYRSSATILIEEQEIPAEFVTATVTSFVEQRLQQINQRIMSTTRLLEVITQFDLYKKMREKRTTEEVVEQMREDVQLKQISTEVVDRATGRAVTATIAFSLSYQGKESPLTVQKVANVLVSLFLKENLEVRERQTKETSKFLEDEMNRVRADLIEAERAVADFKEKNIDKLPELLRLNIQQLDHTEQRMERLEEQLRGFQTQEGYLQAQLANLSPYMENTDRNLLKTLEAELATLQSRFSDIHPDVVKTKAAVNAIKEKIFQGKSDNDDSIDEPDNPAYITLSSQLASIKAEITSVKNQMRELVKTKAKYEARIENTPKVERQYNILVSNQLNLKSKYDELMQKHMEAKVAQGLERGQKGERFTLIDPPRVPEKHASPSRLMIILVGLVMGIGAGVGLAAVREVSDKSVRKAEKLALDTGLLVLGEIPTIVVARDIKRIKIRRVLMTGILSITVAGGIAIFHYFIMDLYIFWAKLDRYIDRYILF